MQPMHQIVVSHRFEEKSKITDSNGFLVTVKKCIDCNKKQRGFKLDANSKEKAKESEMLEEELMELAKKVQENFRAATEWRNQYIRLMLTDTKYSTLEEFIDVGNKRFEYQLDFEDIPLYMLKELAGIQTKNIQRKKVLLFLQGMVCNRCDRPMPTENEFTIDHIDGDRSNGSPKNLQLLCHACHVKKHANGNEVTCLDISPFSHKGEPCVHNLSCVEIDEIMKDYR
ncbi:MAG: HNH endonuclease signature motif containing protein [Caldilineaceae bacterium]|nr:HNH endonuclease signature motif containing protein [Caldilineaceae bacterium]MDE0339861.1 HNH endonuclease signature motif containing protein [Caldilineaceae bacterium]